MVNAAFILSSAGGGAAIEIGGGSAKAAAEAAAADLAAHAEAQSSVSAAKLATELAKQEGVSAGGRSIAGAGAPTGRAIDDINRITSTYGGQAGDWAKMVSNVGHNGQQAHWYENVVTGQIVEVKLK